MIHPKIQLLSSRWSTLSPEVCFQYQASRKKKSVKFPYSAFTTVFQLFAPSAQIIPFRTLSIPPHFPTLMFFLCYLLHLEQTAPSSPLFMVWNVFLNIFFFLFFFFSLLFRAALTAYGGSQARSPIAATAASLHHSHSNVRSQSHLQPTPQLMATLDP